MGLFRNKKKRREEELLALYERGAYLRVDEDVDNKALMLELSTVNKQIEDAKEAKKIEAELQKQSLIKELEERKEELEKLLKDDK